MKKILILAGLLFCLHLLLSDSGTAQTVQSKVLQSYLRYQRTLTTPADLPVEQRALLAVTLAAAETRTADPEELQEVYRQVKAPNTLVLTSDTTYHWVGSSWLNSFKTTYTNHGTKETSETGAAWDGVQWRDTSRQLFTYDGSGNLDTTTLQGMQIGAWTNIERTILIYDAGILSQTISQDWQDSAGGVWVDNWQTIMFYANGRLENALTLLWDGEAWIDLWKTTYTYDASGHLTYWLNQISYDGNTWTNVKRTTYLLDGLGRDTLSFSESYDFISTIWTNVEKVQSSYDGSSNRILGVTWSWTGAAWAKASVDSMKYSGGHLVEVAEYVTGSSPTRIQYAYDASGNVTLFIYQQFAVTWVNVSKTVYVYLEATVSGDVDHTGDVNVSDAVYLLCYIFAACTAPDPMSLGDVDCSGDINIADVVYLVNYIFAGGPGPGAGC